MEIARIPQTARYVFSSWYSAHSAATTELSYILAIPMAQPFKDTAGTRTYPPMYADLTDLWVRYRVTSLKITTICQPTDSTKFPAIIVGHPYRANTSGLTTLAALAS